MPGERVARRYEAGSAASSSIVRGTLGNPCKLLLLILLDTEPLIIFSRAWKETAIGYV